MYCRQDLSRGAALLGEVIERLDILGKARAAITRAGVDKLIANSGVRAHALAHQLDVSAHRLCDIRDFVDEADFRGQHGIGSVLGELGTAGVHEHHFVVVAVERLVQATELGHGGF